MKKVILILALGFFSCQKEEPKPSCTANCGVIANDGITDGCYWLEIRNDCTGNLKTFCFDQDVWLANSPGDAFCVTNEPQW